MKGLLRDIRYGARMLARTPLLSTVAVLTVGLGVGGTTFAYSSTLQLMSRGLPVEEPTRLMAVGRIERSGERVLTSMPFHEFKDYQERQTSFRDLAAGYSGTINIAGDAGPPERFQGGFIMANAFDGLGVPPLLGRSFQADDDRPGAPPLVILGFDVWTNRYGRDPDIVGKSARVNGETATIIGVMPDSFGFPFFEEVWVPLRFDMASVSRSGAVNVQVWGYLRDGVSRREAEAELQRIASDLEREYPETNEGVTVGVMPYIRGMSPPQIDEITLLMLAMAGGLLLVACGNVANLLLARATTREREVAIRTAMGAHRRTVIRQLLAEALVLGLAGGAVGLWLAQLGLSWLTGMAANVQVPYWSVYELDAGALLFTVLVTLVAALLAGTVPAIRASGASAGLILRDESRGSSSLRLGRFSHALVVTELAVTCGLLMASGLVVSALFRITRQDPGFDVAPVVTARLGLFPEDYPSREERNRFFHDLRRELLAESEVTAAAVTTHLPGTGGQSIVRVRVEGERYPLDSDVPPAGSAALTPGLFETFGIEVLEGRDFTLSETEGDGEPVVIVNRSFVERYMAGGSAVGRRLRFGLADDSDAPWRRIVGVVTDTDPGAGRQGLSTGLLPEIVYRPLAATNPRFVSVAVRARSTHAPAISAMRSATAALDPDLPLYWVRSMQEALEEARFLQWIFGLMSGCFSIVALFLAVVGLYGVVDFSVSSRVREIGVRVAVGAGRRDVVWLVARRVAAQLGLGLLIGALLGYAIGQPLSAVMLDVESWEFGVFGVIVAIFAVTTLVATLYPTVRALRVDPVMALRAE